MVDNYYFNYEYKLVIVLSIKLVSEIVISVYEASDNHSVLYQKMNAPYYIQILLILIITLVLFMSEVLKFEIDIKLINASKVLTPVLLCTLLYLYHNYRLGLTVISDEVIYCRGKIFNLNDVKTSTIEMNNEREQLKIVLQYDKIIRIDL